MNFIRTDPTRPPMRAAGLTVDRRRPLYSLLNPDVNASPSILVGCNQKVVCIRVQGKGSFQNSTGIKSFATAMIHRGHRDFVVDLADCPVMDSTFMGTLTGVALRLRELGQGGVHVINSNERNTDLLEGLGLDQILSLENGQRQRRSVRGRRRLPAGRATMPCPRNRPASVRRPKP